MSTGKLKDFLDKYRVVKSSATDKPVYTHTSQGTFQGSYNIPEDKRKELHDLIITTVFNKRTPVHMTEKVEEWKPFTLDFDLQYSQDYPTRQHTPEHIGALCKLYSDTIRKYVEIDPEMAIKLFVFERSGPYPSKGNIKDGVHIIIPDLVTHVDTQHIIRDAILPVCMKEVFDNKILGALPLKNTIEKIIDKDVIASNNWTLFGCSKPALGRYELTHIYEHVAVRNTEFELQELKEHDYSPRDLIDLMSTHRDSDAQRFHVREEHRANMKQLADQANEKKNKKKNIEDRAFIANRKKTTKKQISGDDAKKQFEEANSLMTLLAPYRADQYATWIEIGWCLYNISQSLLDTWIEFSKQSSKFQEGECEELWSRFTEHNMGMGSLHRWAKIDAPEAYLEMRSEFVSQTIFKSLSGTTQDTAEVVYQMFKYQYVCVSAKGDLWYEFKNHRWHECKGGISLKGRIGNDVLNEYLHLVTHYNVSAIESESDRKDQSLQRAKGLTDLTYRLRDLTFKEKIMKECVVMFQNGTFMSELDANPYLLGFENGIYDLANGVFRDGRPEDRVSLSTGIDFPDVELDLDDPTVQEILLFFSQVFPDEALREYVLILLASFLQGTNPDEKFHVFTGVGGNGKSKLIELFEMTIGEYAFKFPISLLTQKRGASGAANPEVARTRGKRFGCFQEPDEGEKINIGLMKELTGGDKILVRALYAEPFEFKPQFKLVLCCNHLPKVPSDDEGTWRRMSVVEFLSKFRTNPDPSNKYEFPKDQFLSQKLQRWKEMFMVILVEYYKKYKSCGLVEPAEVRKATQEYLKDSDMYTQFRDDKMVKDEYGLLKLEEAYVTFKSWYTDNMIGKPPVRREFKNNIEHKLGVKYGHGPRAGWSGWRLMSMDDNEESTETAPPAIGPGPDFSKLLSNSATQGSSMKAKITITPKK